MTNPAPDEDRAEEQEERRADRQDTPASGRPWDSEPEPAVSPTDDPRQPANPA